MSTTSTTPDSSGSLSGTDALRFREARKGLASSLTMNALGQAVSGRSEIALIESALAALLAWTLDVDKILGRIPAMADSLTTIDEALAALGAHVTQIETGQQTETSTIDALSGVIRSFIASVQAGTDVRQLTAAQHDQAQAIVDALDRIDAAQAAADAAVTELEAEVPAQPAAPAVSDSGAGEAPAQTEPVAGDATSPDAPVESGADVSVSPDPFAGDTASEPVASEPEPASTDEAAATPAV